MDPNVETTPSGPSSLEKFASPMADDLNFNPYYLGNSNNSGTLLVTQPLNGAGNQPFWSQSMVLALTTKNKICIVNGTIVAPVENSPLVNAWTHCNTMVLSWLFNLIHKNIASSVMYNDTARQVWISSIAILIEMV